MKKIYGVGVGPGDPNLLTIAGLNALHEAEIIFTPRAASSKTSLAKDIISYHNIASEKCFDLEFLMTEDTKKLDTQYQSTASLIREKMEDISVAAYVTIGDPLLYSTYIYLIDALKKQIPEIEIKTVPGISAASALAAAFNFSIAEKKERICICPAPAEKEELRGILENHDTIILYKIAKKFVFIRELLLEMDLLKCSVFGSKIGLPDEFLQDGRLSEIVLPDGEDYLSTIIVRRNLQ